jgi:hypothetical protein
MFDSFRLGEKSDRFAVAERMKAPIVHSLRGKEFIEYDNPFDVGMTGHPGFSSGYRDDELRCAAHAGNEILPISSSI